VCRPLLQANLQAKLGNINRIRSLAGQQANVRRCETSEEAAVRAAALEAKNAAEASLLAERLAAKRAAARMEAERLAAEQKANQFALERFSASKGLLEQRKKHELDKAGGCSEQALVRRCFSTNRVRAYVRAFTLKVSHAGTSDFGWSAYGQGP